MIRRPPRSTLFPTRRSSDLVPDQRIGFPRDLQEAGAARRRPQVPDDGDEQRSEEHTSELQSPCNIVCRLLLEKKKNEPTTCHSSISSYTRLHTRTHLRPSHA